MWSTSFRPLRPLTMTESTALSAAREELLSLLREGGRGGANRFGDRVRSLITQLEQQQPSDLARDTHWLQGVWELRWSDGSQPYLPWHPGWRTCRCWIRSRAAA